MLTKKMVLTALIILAPAGYANAATLENESTKPELPNTTPIKIRKTYVKKPAPATQQDLNKLTQALVLQANSKHHKNFLAGILVGATAAAVIGHHKQICTYTKKTFAKIHSYLNEKFGEDLHVLKRNLQKTVLELKDKVSKS